MSRKAVGFVFLDNFADWEFGFISGVVEDGLPIQPIALTPGSRVVTSIGGVQLLGKRGLTPEENADLDAVVVVGSDDWASGDGPEMSPLLTAVAARGGVVGGICGGTLALARAGLFSDKTHTSNGRDWLRKHAPGYAGSDNYIDVPHAVADRQIISAPGTAPGTFAVCFLEALLPAKADEIAALRTILAREHSSPTT